MVRAVRDSEFRYVRNYSPHRPWGQHYSYAFQVQPSMRSWHAEFVAGRCNEVQAAYWKSKPGEEFYRIEDDPLELKNRVINPEFAAHVARLREALREEILATRDVGFIPEGMMERLAGDQTIYEYAQSDAYPLRRILAIADKASQGDVGNLPELIIALDDPDPVVRYWGATGCLILREEASEAKAKLLERLTDQWRDVRVVAAEAVAYLGERQAAAMTIASVIERGDFYEVLAAQNALDFMWQAGHVTLEDAQQMIRDREFREPADRIPRYLLRK